MRYLLRDQQCALIAMTLSSSCAGPRSATAGRNVLALGFSGNSLDLLHCVLKELQLGSGMHELLCGGKGSHTALVSAASGMLRTCIFSPVLTGSFFFLFLFFY